MSSYHTKGVINRYWKRPKPRVYECNVRDAERFYNQSYKEYLEAKEASGRRDVGSGLVDESPGTWKVQRSNSLLDSMSDSAYEIPVRGAYSRNYGDDSYSGPRASSITGSRNAADNDSTHYEHRIQKVQKLRSELGLPTEIGGGGGTTKVTFDLPSETTSTFSSRRIASPDPRGMKGRGFDSSADSSSYSSTRSTGRSRASDLASDSYGDALSTGSERTSRFSSKYSNNDDSYKPNGDKYSSSSKSSRRFDMDDDSFSSRPSDSTSSFKSSRKVATTSAIDDADDCDADAFLSNMKKKFPTSDEILERIKKMDAEI